MRESTIKILMAEDDMAMRDIVSHKLTGKGFKVLLAKNGVEAVDIVQKEKPDLILLDLLMPELDGFGVLEKIRSNPDPKIAKMPVVVLSNLWSNQDILKAQSLKADDFLVKAYFTTEEIYNKICKLLEKREDSK